MSSRWQNKVTHEFVARFGASAPCLLFSKAAAEQRMLKAEAA